MVPVRILFENLDNPETESVKVGFARDGITEEQVSLILDIRDSSGKSARMGLQFHASPYGKTARDFFVTLAPGHFYGWTEKLIPYTHAFLNDPGEYTITAHYGYVAPNGNLQNPIRIFSGDLKSATLKFTIVQPPPEQR